MSFCKKKTGYNHFNIMNHSIDFCDSGVITIGADPIIKKKYYLYDLSYKSNDLCQFFSM